MSDKSEGRGKRNGGKSILLNLTEEEWERMRDGAKIDSRTLSAFIRVSTLTRADYLKDKERFKQNEG